MINKKSQMTNLGSIILVILLILLVMGGGIMLAFGGAIVKISTDTLVPQLSNLGQIGDNNFTQIAGQTINPVNSVLSSISWMTGLAYVIVLIILLGLSWGYRFTGNKWLMGFFILCMILVVVTSIFISNIYEGFFTGTDDFALALQSQTLLSWLLLYSPIVMCIIGFLCGIIMFTGDGQEDSSA